MKIALVVMLNVCIEGIMRFMIVEKNRLTFPALISRGFNSASEAKRYGFTKPKEKQAEIFKIEKGFELIEQTSKFNVPLDQVPENKKKIECGKVTLFLKDLHKYCRVVVFQQWSKSNWGKVILQLHFHYL